MCLGIMFLNIPENVRNPISIGDDFKKLNFHKCINSIYLISKSQLLVAFCGFH